MRYCKRCVMPDTKRGIYFDANGEAICPESEQRYSLQENKVSKIDN